MLGLLLLQVLASCLWLGHSEVVTSFTSCSQFFFNGIPPNDGLHPINPAWICQIYNNSYHFATLYNKDERIPVYSAYIYQPGHCNRTSTWFIEPQLINPTYSKAMDTQGSIRKKYNINEQQMDQNQAINQDYDSTKDFHRGHLNPCSHNNNANNARATFTLTNAVPQNKKLNQGAWRTYEVTTMAQKTQNCIKTYVITGAVPGNRNISGGRVNVPSHIWSAACCLRGTQPWKAWGAIAENNKNEVVILSLGDLEARLSQLHKGKMVTLFNNACPR